MKHKYKNLAPVVLRIGVSLVFLWFGINQLINPGSFIGYVPQWAYPHGTQVVHSHSFQFMHVVPKPSVNSLVIINGILETVLGMFLLVGLFIGVTSVILAAHLLVIALGMGSSEIAVRDFGLSVATFTVFLLDSDKYSLDSMIARKG
ncbi:MAG: DoxX family protein [Candidatus Magasanikbacteria bacterium]